MHDIEPHYRWRDEYTAETDRQSPFYKQIYSELHFTNKIYNYYIHPQWDNFGSQTLYVKILFVEYDKSYAIIELIGEWNDCLYNDIMYLKSEVINVLNKSGISKFILMCDNVLAFHSSDDSYYEEWWDDIKEEDGWVVIINTFDNVQDEMKRARLHYYVNFGARYNDIMWQNKTPEIIYKVVKKLLQKEQKYI
jgi:hypothetical protein